MTRAAWLWIFFLSWLAAAISLWYRPWLPLPMLPFSERNVVGISRLFLFCALVLGFGLGRNFESASGGHSTITASKWRATVARFKPSVRADWVTAVGTVGLVIGATVATVLAWWNLRDLETQTGAALKQADAAVQSLQLARDPFVVAEVSRDQNFPGWQTNVGEGPGQVAMKVDMVNVGAGIADHIEVDGWVVRYDVFQAYTPSETAALAAEFQQSVASKPPDFIGAGGTLTGGERTNIWLQTTADFHDRGVLNGPGFALVTLVSYDDVLGRRKDSQRRTIWNYTPGFASNPPEFWTPLPPDPRGH